MRNFLAGLLAPRRDSHKDEEAMGFLRSSEFFEHKPATAAVPEHFASNAVINIAGQTATVRTAIVIHGSDVEFTTNIGRVPQSSLTFAVANQLNHVLVGKVVLFDGGDRAENDVVYASRKHLSNVSDRTSIMSELEHHGKVQFVVAPVLRAATEFLRSHPVPDISRSVIFARDIVKDGLGQSGILSVDATANQYPVVLVSSQSRDNEK